MQVLLIPLGRLHDHDQRQLPSPDQLHRHLHYAGELPILVGDMRLTAGAGGHAAGHVGDRSRDGRTLAENQRQLQPYIRSYQLPDGVAKPRLRNYRPGRCPPVHRSHYDRQLIRKLYGPHRNRFRSLDRRR